MMLKWLVRLYPTSMYSEQEEMFLLSMIDLQLRKHFQAKVKEAVNTHLDQEVVYFIFFSGLNQDNHV